MTASKTLREVAGLGHTPGRLSASALIMVDLQQTYREGVMQLVGVEQALDQAQRLLARARSAGIPIFHIQHNAGVGSPYDITAPIGAIADKVAPVAGEVIIEKTHPNSFFNTSLQQQLESANVQQVVIAGFMTHMCINSTARGAFNLGFAPTVVASTTATRNLPRGKGGVVAAADLQAASLAAIDDLFGVVVESVDDLAL